MQGLNLLYFFCSLALVVGSPLVTNLRDDSGTQKAAQNDRAVKNVDIYRLPDDVEPLSYVLRIVPDLETFTFTGKVQISVHVKFATNRIILHSKKLSIKSASLTKSGSSIDTTRQFDEANDLLIIESTQPFAYNTDYSLIIEFQGTLEDNLIGFYRSSYTVDGKLNWLAITQFEPNHARLAFPCFDEPRFRAPFTVYLAFTKTQLAVSNMPTDTQLPSDSASGADRVWQKFQQSPPMPTYLVSFMVADFTYVSDTAGKIRLLARKNAIQRVKYAFKQSSKVLQQLEGYTGITYSLPKLDIVAVPDFLLGAMENWGMVAYKERFLMLDESSSSAQHRQISTQLLSHELAHQWFGNLVTPAWYDFTWLKEGFATYFESFTSAAIEPTWNLDQLFVVEVHQEALWHEIPVERPMTTSIRKSNQLDNVFDIISYDKAGAIIRMFEHMVSPSTFKSALNKFLKDGSEKYSGVVSQQHLLDAFDAQLYRTASYLPPNLLASDIIRTWTENVGYPLLNVTRDYDKEAVVVNQEPYEKIKLAKSQEQQKWIIPLTYTHKSELKFSDTRPTSWSYADRQTTLPVPVPKSDWILLNIQQTGYYRVTYDSKNWDLLIEQLRQDPQKIHILNRANLLDDAFALAYDDKLPYTVTLNLAQYLSKETEMIPWYSATKSFNKLRRELEGTQNYDTLQNFIRELIKTPYETFGFDIKSTDSHHIRIIKPLFLNLACRVGIENCVTKSLEEYKTNEADLSKIQPDLRKVIYCQALMNSNDPQSVFNNLWNTYTKTDVSFEKQEILTSLTCAKDEDVIKKVLSKIFDPTNKEIRSQDRMYFLDHLSSQITATTATLKFIGEKASKLSDYDQTVVSLLKNLLYSMESGVKTQSQAQQLKELETQFASVDQQKHGEFNSIIKTLQSEADENIKFSAKLMDGIHKYLVPTSTSDNSKPPTDNSQSTADQPKPAESAAVSSIPTKLWWQVTLASFTFYYGLSISRIV